MLAGDAIFFPCQCQVGLAGGKLWLDLMRSRPAFQLCLQKYRAAAPANASNGIAGGGADSFCIASIYDDGFDL
jgi:hypothetical protein